MKLKKDQFKKILKECIMELVEEGAFDKVISESLQTAGHARPAANDLVSGGGGNDNPYQFDNSVGQMTPNQRLKEIARMTAAGVSGNDPQRANMMASILEDTVKTTWQQTMAAERGGPGVNQVFVGESVNPEQVKVEQAELEALSAGRGVKHWAALAFGKYNK